MVCNGYVLYGSQETSRLLKAYPDIASIHPEIHFRAASFCELSDTAHAKYFDIHIVVAEIFPDDSADIWFPVLSGILKAYPFVKIVFILNGELGSDFYYLNQIPFTYLLPSEQIPYLLQTGLDKAVTELNRYTSVKHSSDNENSSFENAAFLSTDGLTGKGRKGCQIYYPDGSTIYTRLSLKTIMPNLPGNFVQVHKSYVLNMNYCGERILKKRASGKAQDEYIELKCAEYPGDVLIPVGPKYRREIMEYVLNKYAYPLLNDSERKGTEYE